MEKDRVDITKLVRSIQRSEGHPDCFRSDQDLCDKIDCTWRTYCLEENQDQTLENSDSPCEQEIMVPGMSDALEDLE